MIEITNLAAKIMRTFILLSVILSCFVWSCGPSKAELEKQRIKDSIEAISDRENSIDAANDFLNMDSLASDSIGGDSIALK